LICKEIFKVTFGRFAAAADYFANPLVNLTRNGKQSMAFISFWAMPALPLRAGYRERWPHEHTHSSPDTFLKRSVNGRLLAQA
jgi:hypothetical protein